MAVMCGMLNARMISHIKTTCGMLFFIGMYSFRCIFNNFGFFVSLFLHKICYHIPCSMNLSMGVFGIIVHTISLFDGEFCNG